MNQRPRQSQDLRPRSGPVKVLAKNQVPPPELPEPQIGKPMDNYEQLKETEFSEKQSLFLANVIGLIRKDIEKLTNYVVARFAAMDIRIDGLDKKNDGLKVDMKEGFTDSDKKNDGLKADTKEGFTNSGKKIDELRAEMKEGFADSDKKIDGLRAEMKEGFADSDKKIDGLRAEMKEGFADSDKKIDKLKTELKANIKELDKKLWWMNGLMLTTAITAIFFLAKLSFFPH